MNWQRQALQLLWCDNVCVIRAGKLVGKLGKDQMNQEEIMKYAAGGVE